MHKTISRNEKTKFFYLLHVMCLFFIRYVVLNFWRNLRLGIERPDKLPMFMHLESTMFPAYAFPYVAFARLSLSLSLSPFAKANPYPVVSRSPRATIRSTQEYCRYFRLTFITSRAASRDPLRMSFTRDVPFDVYQYLF